MLVRNLSCIVGIPLLDHYRLFICHHPSLLGSLASKSLATQRLDVEDFAVRSSVSQYGTLEKELTRLC